MQRTRDVSQAAFSHWVELCWSLTRPLPDQSIWPGRFHYPSWSSLDIPRLDKPPQTDCSRSQLNLESTLVGMSHWKIQCLPTTSTWFSCNIPATNGDRETEHVGEACDTSHIQGQFSYGAQWPSCVMQKPSEEKSSCRKALWGECIYDLVCKKPLKGKVGVCQIGGTVEHLCTSTIKSTSDHCEPLVALQDRNVKLEGQPALWRPVACNPCGFYA